MVVAAAVITISFQRSDLGLPDFLDEAPPKPLSFLVDDFIHPDNQKLIEESLQRFTPLNWRQRWKLRRRMEELRRELRRAGWNQLCDERAEVFKAWKSHKDEAVPLQALLPTADDDTKRKYKHAIKTGAALQRRGRELDAQIDRLRELYHRFAHVADHLEYDAKHHRELVEQEREEKRNRAEMRKEARWLETLMRDVWRRTKGCHYIGTDARGREFIRVPWFHRSTIDADSHWFLLATSEKTVFGWRWLLPYGVSVRDLVSEETLENMRAATRREVEVHWSQTGQLWLRVNRLDSPSGLPRRVMWRDLMRHFPTERRSRFVWTVGVVQNRKLDYCELANPLQTHIVVAGSTGSGKSNTVNGIIGTLVSTHSPAELVLYCIDGKGGGEFVHWEELPHLLGEIITSAEQFLPALEYIKDIMRSRQKLFAAVHAKDIDSYNRKVTENKRIPRVLVVIDEMNVFLLHPDKQQIHNLIANLTAQSRSAGIHFILATQRPEVAVIPGLIKDNCGVRIAHFMTSDVGSMTILDSVIASELPAEVPGRGIVGRGNKYIEFQAGYISVEDIADLVATSRKKYGTERARLAEIAFGAPVVKLWDEEAVLELALTLPDNLLSAKTMDEFLAANSPGEWTFRQMINKIRSRFQQDGYIRFGDAVYVIERHDRKTYCLVEVPQTEQSAQSESETTDSANEVTRIDEKESPNEDVRNNADTAAADVGGSGGGSDSSRTAADAAVVVPKRTARAGNRKGKQTRIRTAQSDLGDGGTIRTVSDNKAQPGQPTIDEQIDAIIEVTK